MNQIRIHFTEFWQGFEPENNFFTSLLRKKYDVVIDDRTPDIVFSSVNFWDWQQYDCKKVLFIGENLPPERSEFDYCFSFHPTAGDNFHLPIFRLDDAYKKCFYREAITREQWQARKGVNFVCSNPRSPMRNWFYHKLSEEIPVSSGGRLFNTVGGPICDKSAFQNGFNFTIAFENTSWPGYLTEKLIQAYAFGTVPIYWGDPDVDRFIDPKSFIPFSGKKDFDKVLQTIKRGLEDFDFYQSLYAQPLFKDNKEPQQLSDDTILKFLEKIVGAPRMIERDVRLASGYSRELWIKRFNSTRFITYEEKWKVRFFEAFFLPEYLYIKTKKHIKLLLLQEKTI